MNRFSWSPPGRKGSTLVELTVALVGASVLMVGLSSTILIALRSTDTSRTATADIKDGNTALTELLCDIEFALSITESSATAIAFIVPDRDGDSSPETFRYAWSGTPGDPLTRQYNGGVPTTVVNDVRVFQHDLPPPTPNLLANPDLEAGTLQWEAFPQSSLSEESYTVHNGGASLYDYRWTANDESGVRQNVASQIANGTTYQLGGWMMKWAASQPFGTRVQLRLHSTGDGEQIFASETVDVNNTSWTLVEGTVTPTWSGTLLSACWEACGVDKIQEIYVDDVYLRVKPVVHQVINIRLQVGSDAHALVQSGVALLNSPL